MQEQLKIQDWKIKSTIFNLKFSIFNLQSSIFNPIYISLLSELKSLDFMDEVL